MKDTRKRVKATKIYLESPQYAVDNEELDKFRESNRESRQCLQDISDAIKSNYDGWRLNGNIASDIINQYGIDMVKYVLATVIKEQEWDGRYSTANRQWLADVPVSKSENVRRRLTTSVHPGLLDMFMTQVRKSEHDNETKASRKVMRANKGVGKESPYPQGSVMDDAWLTWQQELQGKTPPEITEGQIFDMAGDVVARHYPDLHPDSDAFAEKSLDIGTELLLDAGVDLWAGMNRKNTKASKVRAMYEALDGMGGESDYVSTGDIVDDGGYSYEIVSVLDVKEDSGYEVALAEAVNADRGMTEFLVLLNGDVDWKDDSMEAAREFYENTDYSELDNIGEEDMEMEDSFDMYEADDDIVAAYRESGDKKSDDKNEARKRARERCAKRKKEMQAKKVAEMRKRVHANIEKSMKAAKNKDREKPVSITAMAKKDGKSVKWNVEIKASITEKGKRYSVQGVRQLAEAMGVKPNELDVAAMYEACKQNGYNALAIENGKAKFGKVNK